MIWQFDTANENGDWKSNETELKESPLTISCVFVIQFCETGGFDPFIHCRMTIRYGHPLRASMGRTANAEAGETMASGLTDPWPTSFPAQYIRGRRTMGPQPWIVNILWLDYPTIMHSYLFDLFCEIKESTDHNDAPDRNLPILQYPKQSLYSRRTHPSRETGRSEDLQELHVDENRIDIDETGGDLQNAEYGAEEYGAEEEGAESLPVINRANMRHSLDATRTELVQNSPPLLEDSFVAECHAFVRQSAEDDHEDSFKIVTDRLALYRETNTKKSLLDSMMKHTQEMLVGISMFVSQLGASSFKGIGFKKLAESKVHEMNAAIKESSYATFSQQRNELRSVFSQAMAEIKADAAQQANTTVALSAEEKRLADLREQVREMEQQLAENKRRKRVALEAEQARNQGTMALLRDQLDVLQGAFDRLATRNSEIAAELMEA